MDPLLDRNLFSIPQHLTWIMHCAVGPLPNASAEAAQRMVEKEHLPWTMSVQDDFLGEPAGLRNAAACLLSCRSEDITLVPNTSSGLALIAQNFPWKPGDEVLAPLGEFPANAWPWIALRDRGVTFHQVPLWDGHAAGVECASSAPPDGTCDPESRLIQAIGNRTRLLTLSWVRFQDGLRLDLARIAEACARRGIPVVVDGIQGAGICQIHDRDLQHCAAFSCGGHKGLLGMSGQGFLWTAPAFRHTLNPAGSWLSVEDAMDFQRPSTDFSRAWRDDGQRLEQGNYNVVGCAALLASLKLLHATGAEAIEAHIRLLQQTCLQELSSIACLEGEVERLQSLVQAGRQGPFLAIHHGGRGLDFWHPILKQGMASGVMATARDGYLRLAFHGYHGSNDLAAVVAWLKASLASQ